MIARNHYKIKDGREQRPHHNRATNNRTTDPKRRDSSRDNSPGLSSDDKTLPQKFRLALHGFWKSSQEHFFQAFSLSFCRPLQRPGSGQRTTGSGQRTKK